MSLYTNKILELFTEKSRNSPKKIIISQTDGQEICYQDLFNSITRVAENLESAGFKKGHRALILMRPGINAVIVFLSVLRLGGVVVFADPGMGTDIFQSRITLVNPGWYFVESAIAYLQYLPFVKKILRDRNFQIPDFLPLKSMQIVYVGLPLLSKSNGISFSKLLKEKNKTNKFVTPLKSINSNTDACIVFTSGTTSQPRAVVHSIYSLAKTLEELVKITKLKTNDIFYTSLPHFLLLAVSSGVKSVVPMKPFSAQSFYRDIYQYKATILFAPPSELLSINSYLGNFSKKIPRAVSKIFIGSAPVLTGFLRNFLKIVHPATQVFCAYGLTEILPVALVDARAKIKWKGKGDLLGTITSGINYKIEEDKELVINAPQMCKRYFGNRNLTSVKTGDLVKVDNHELILLGRKKDMIIRGNYNIYPTLYENTISKIPDILACALVGIHFEEEADEKIILAIESRRKYSDNFRNKILLYLKNGVYSIDTIAFPDEIIFMTIPRKGRQGKIDKDQLLLNIRKTLL